MSWLVRAMARERKKALKEALERSDHIEGAKYPQLVLRKGKLVTIPPTEQ